MTKLGSAVMKREKRRRRQRLIGRLEGLGGVAVPVTDNDSAARRTEKITRYVRYVARVVYAGSKRKHDEDILLKIIILY